MKSSLPKTPPPKIFKTVKGAKKTRLPARTFPDSEFIRVLTTRETHRRFSNHALTLEAISQILSLVWSATDYLHSPLFGKLLHKTSPSGGARHPGEVYLMALRVKGLRAGLYHYHPGQHHLATISRNATRAKAWQYCAHQDYVRNAAALFLMTAVFPAHNVEVSTPSCLPRGASRRRPSVPNVLPRGDLAWPRAVLYSGAEGHINRKGPWDRWDPRVGALCSGSRCSCSDVVSARRFRLRLGRRSTVCVV